MPKVSVIIPSYNHAAYISAAVKSVLVQTESDLELIVVDDGSQDNTLAILKQTNDPRLRIIAQENRGAHAAINRGLSEAGGDYLAILNSDDCFHHQRVEVLVSVLETNPDIGLASSYIEVINEHGQTLGVKRGYQSLEPWSLARPERSFRAGSDLQAALHTENYLSTTSNYLFTRSWYERVGPFLPLRYTHDWDFALRMTHLAGLHLETEPLLQYRVHRSNTIRENQTAMVFEICWCLAVHLPHFLSDVAQSDGQTQATTIDRLLHSIYAFHTEPVLAGLLAQNLSQNTDHALALLSPDNPTRRVFLDYIADVLPNGGTSHPSSPLGKIYSFLQWMQGQMRQMRLQQR